MNASVIPSRQMKAPDRIDVARQALGQVLTHPATWAPFVPIAGAYAFIGLPWWVCFPLLLAVVVVLFLAWGRQWARLMDKTRTEMLAAYRTQENAALGERMQRLVQAGGQRRPGDLPGTLREAMSIKQAVEDRLHADGVVTAHEEEVGTMIGELVRTMVEEAERLTLTEGGAVSRQAPDRFHKAADTLRQAYADLDVILDPVPEDLRLPAGDDALSRASERLGDRLEQARGVRRHLERDVVVHDAEIVPESPAPRRPAQRQPTAES